VLECRGIRKAFGANVALDAIDLAIRAGEIHALVGQNGAGKSTLVKILTGVYRATSGEMRVDGKPVRIATPQDAEAAGIVIVHQDQQLVEQFDVTRNIFLGREEVRNGLLDFASMRSRAEELLRRVGANFSQNALVRELSVAERALVSIAGALLRRPRVLILDEPTASLSNEESDRLFDIVRGLRDEGVTIIFISHYLDEIFELVDRITVLRDGKLVSTQDISATSRQAVIKEMVGRSLAQLYPKEDIQVGPVMLAIDALSQGDNVSDVSLSVRRCEIFGIAGLVGSGSTELAMALMGALPRSGGSVTLDGKPSAPSSPRAAKAEGFALVPEDRRHEGVLGELTMRENLSLPNIKDFSSLGFLRLGKEKAWAKELIEKLRIAPPKMNQLVRTLSGGNQQKVVIGRWLVGDVKVFLFDEPTTGIDVGSKVEVYHQMTKVARAGAAVIFISSDFDELVGMCDRVAVMYKGKVAAIHERGALDVPSLMIAATGGLGARPETAHDAPRGHAAKGPRARSSAFLTRWGTIAGMVVILGVMGVVAPDFLLPSNLLDVLKQGSLLAFVALGLTAVLAAGGFDMSVGAVNQFSANLAAGSIGKGLGIPVALAFGVGAGLVAGCANAALVLVFGMPPFVATVGTMFVAMGLSLLYNRGQALTLSDQPEFFFIGQGHIGPIPFVAVILLAALIALHVLLRHTRPGLRLSAVGLNLAAAGLRGVSRTRAVGLSFILGGLVIGLSGVVFASYSYGASAVATGLDFLINALAAAFLGTSLTRSGEFDVVGTTIAALFLASLSNGLVLMGISNLALPGIQGAALILSILLSALKTRAIGQVTNL
jgi:ABC-type sugar transport system ATPase subunit/ribose/xylose/arabinose/galactoside ABC-type transport system permease subunit